MKVFWLAALALLRPAYFIYALLCLLAPLFMVISAAYGLNNCFFHLNFPSIDLLANLLAKILLAVFTTLVFFIPVLAFARKGEGNPHYKHEPDPNPFQSAFMSWFATLRCYWNNTPGAMAKVGLPSGYLVENPPGYRITAKDMREILEKLQPGDILLRAYDGYVDGQLIRLASKCSKRGYEPGWFTHVALYVGTLHDEDHQKVPTEFRNDPNYFQACPQMIVHSMAKGVHTEDILTWFRCDYLAVLRIKADKSLDIKNETRTNAIQNAKLSALEKIGEPYNFECITTTKFNRFSCAEFVYFCFRGIHDIIDLHPRLHALYPFGKWLCHWNLLGRVTVTPDDYYDLGKSQHLDIIWVDEISRSRA